jgi:hypothetical protein
MLTNQLISRNFEDIPFGNENIKKFQKKFEIKFDFDEKTFYINETLNWPISFLDAFKILNKK